MKTGDDDSLFGFGRCSTLNWKVWNGSPSELEWYRVWWLRVVAMASGSRSE